MQSQATTASIDVDSAEVPSRRISDNVESELDSQSRAKSSILETEGEDACPFRLLR